MNNLISLSKHLLSKMSLHLNYGHEIKIDITTLKAQVDKDIPITVECFQTLTIKEAKTIGFCKWSDDNPKLMLIPGYLYNFLPKGLCVLSIDGESKIIGEETIDNDTRFGCLAWGIIIAEEVK